MRISDWSSDVCSSDLRAHPFDGLDDVFAAALGYFQGKRRLAVEPREAFRVLEAAAQARDVAKVHYCVATHLDREVDDVLHGLEQADRKSVVKGKSVSVRGDLGGRLYIKKKYKINYKRTTRHKIQQQR